MDLSLGFLSCSIDLYFCLCSKPTFSLSYFTFIKRLFSSSSLSFIRVVSSAYLRLLIFRPTILIPPWDSLSLAFRLMYSACKLNKQGDNIQPRHTPFPIWNQSVVLEKCKQIYSEVSPHTSQNAYNKKFYKQYMLERVWRKQNAPTLLVRM